MSGLLVISCVVWSLPGRKGWPVYGILVVLINMEIEQAGGRRVLIIFVRM